MQTEQIPYGLAPILISSHCHSSSSSSSKKYRVDVLMPTLVIPKDQTLELKAVSHCDGFRRTVEQETTVQKNNHTRFFYLACATLQRSADFHSLDFIWVDSLKDNILPNHVFSLFTRFKIEILFFFYHFNRLIRVNTIGALIS